MGIHCRKRAGVQLRGSHCSLQRASCIWKETEDGNKEVSTAAGFRQRRRLPDHGGVGREPLRVGARGAARAPAHVHAAGQQCLRHLCARAFSVPDSGRSGGRSVRFTPGSDGGSDRRGTRQYRLDVLAGNPLDIAARAIRDRPRCGAGGQRRNRMGGQAAWCGGYDAGGHLFDLGFHARSDRLRHHRAPRRRPQRDLYPVHRVDSPVCRRGGVLGRGRRCAEYARGAGGEERRRPGSPC